MAFLPPPPQIFCCSSLLWILPDYSLGSCVNPVSPQHLPSVFHVPVDAGTGVSGRSKKVQEEEYGDTELSEMPLALGILRRRQQNTDKVTSARVK